MIADMFAFSYNYGQQFSQFGCKKCAWYSKLMIIQLKVPSRSGKCKWQNKIKYCNTCMIV